MSKKIKIPEKLVKEARDYAEDSKRFTSDRHDFHEGGLDAKRQKMFEGKLGEKLFKFFLSENDISFKEDQTDHTKRDLYDFRLLDVDKTVDVKTRTKDFHIRTLEIKEQFDRQPKDIYVSVHLYTNSFEGEIIGWFTKEDVTQINRVENNGYLDNYVIYDRELKDVSDLLDLLKN